MGTLARIVNFIIALIAVFVFILCGLVFGVGFVHQSIDKRNFEKYSYRITQDNIFWMTDSYKVNGNCVEFVNNYGKETSFCEKYQIDSNYWKDNSPSIKSIWYGY